MNLIEGYKNSIQVTDVYNITNNSNRPIYLYSCVNLNSYVIGPSDTATILQDTLNYNKAMLEDVSYTKSYTILRKERLGDNIRKAII